MKYLIKNKKYNTYYSKQISNLFHFVVNEKVAHTFKNEEAANKIMKLFKNKDNFEIVKM